MSLHKQKAFSLLSKAYPAVMEAIPEPSPRTLSRMQNKGVQIDRRYLWLDLIPCHKTHISQGERIDVPIADQKPTYHTISTNEENVAVQGREQRNPYQGRAKINYFQSAMRNVDINSNLAPRESKKKLHNFVKSSTAKVQKFRKMNTQKQEMRETSPHLGASQSAKHQISLKSELESRNQVPQDNDLALEWAQLREKVQILEQENKKLREENKKLKKRREGKPPGSHYKPKCAKMKHTRGNSRTSTGQGFSHTDMLSDATRSYSFENGGNGKPQIDTEFLKSYNNYVPIPHKMSNKENIGYNIKIEQMGKPKGGQESILMQKVSRILKKSKNKAKFTPRDSEVLSEGRGEVWKSLKHSKNEIIARINNKYGNRME